MYKMLFYTSNHMGIQLIERKHLVELSFGLLVQHRLVRLQLQELDQELVPNGKFVYQNSQRFHHFFYQ